MRILLFISILLLLKHAFPVPSQSYTRNGIVCVFWIEITDNLLFLSLRSSWKPIALVFSLCKYYIQPNTSSHMYYELCGLCFDWYLLDDGELRWNFPYIFAADVWVFGVFFGIHGYSGVWNSVSKANFGPEDIPCNYSRTATFSSRKTMFLAPFFWAPRVWNC